MRYFFKSGLVVLLLVLAMPATAQPALSEAKADGLVGERIDGLVGIVVADPSPALEQMVSEINDQRMTEYRQIAEDTDAPLQAVQQRAGRQLIQRLNEGEYFTDASGRWRQK